MADGEWKVQYHEEWGQPGWDVYRASDNGSEIHTVAHCYSPTDADAIVADHNAVAQLAAARADAEALAAAIERYQDPPQGTGGRDSYGRYACGCSWNSGPYAEPCEEHDPESLFDAALAFHESLRSATPTSAGGTE